MRFRKIRKDLLMAAGTLASFAVLHGYAVPSMAEESLPEDPAVAAEANPPQPETRSGSGRGVDVTTEADRAASTAQAEASGMSTESGDKVSTNLDQYMANKNKAQFTGRPITLQVREVEAVDIFRLIGEASGFNIVLSDEVKGKLTLSLVDVPWDQALDVVLHSLRLGAERNNNILRITTLESLTTEKQALLAAQRASDASAPKITKVFPISYANLGELQGTLAKLVSTQGAVQGIDSGSQSVVTIDNRTNSLIVRDIPANVERIQKLIEVLDTQTPQVLVEAKIIEASEGFSKSISGSLGVGGSTNNELNQFGTSFSGGNPTDPLIGSPGIFSDGTTFAGNSAGGGTFGGSLTPETLRFLPGIKRLNAILNLGESENQVKVLSSPRTVVINKQAAKIVQGTPVLVPGTSFVAGVGTVPTTSVTSANLSLEATPTVTNDGGVLMQLKVSRDIPFNLGSGGTAVANRNLETQVLVDSGSTLVIGGIYTMTNNHSASGFPYLRKIPILGALFGSESDQTDRSELFIFITPRILNVKEAGLAG